MDFNIDYSTMSKQIIESLDYIYDTLMQDYPNANFTIKKNYFNSNALAIVVHDSDIFYNPKFQNWAFLQLPQEYLYPKRIFNIVFIYEKQ